MLRGQGCHMLRGLRCHARAVTYYDARAYVRKRASSTPSHTESQKRDLRDPYGMSLNLPDGTGEDNHMLRGQERIITGSRLYHVTWPSLSHVTGPGLLHVAGPRFSHVTKPGLSHVTGPGPLRARNVTCYKAGAVICYGSKVFTCYGATTITYCARPLISARPFAT